MALAHPESCECSKSEIQDIFDVPPTQTVIKGGRWVEHHPVASLSDGSPIEFNVSGSGDDYLDLANSLLQVSASIRYEDGSALVDDADVAPVNLWMHSLFSQVDVSLNGTLVSSSTHNYPFRAFVEKNLSFGSDAKKSQLTAEMWHQDTAGKMTFADRKDNQGFLSRQARTKNSRIVHMMGRLHADLFNQDRELLNNVDLRLRLTRSKDSFSLMCPGGGDRYKVKIHRAVLYVRKVEVEPSVHLSHLKALEKKTAKYPIRRVQTKVFSVASGTSVVNRENLFLGSLPRRLVLGCVTNNAYNGTLETNPFHFHHHNLNFLALYLDGKQVPAKPLQPDFQRGDYVRSYLSLFQATGKLNQNDGNGISYNDFSGGCALFAFDLTADLSDQCHFQPVKEGSLRLEMRFASPVTETLDVITYAEFDNVIEIDRSRNILFDYAA